MSDEEEMTRADYTNIIANKKLPLLSNSQHLVWTM